MIDRHPFTIPTAYSQYTCSPLGSFGVNEELEKRQRSALVPGSPTFVV